MAHRVVGFRELGKRWSEAWRDWKSQRLDQRQNYDRVKGRSWQGSTLHSWTVFERWVLFRGRSWQGSTLRRRTAFHKGFWNFVALGCFHASFLSVPSMYGVHTWCFGGHPGILEHPRCFTKRLLLSEDSSKSTLSESIKKTFLDLWNCLKLPCCSTGESFGEIESYHLSNENNTWLFRVYRGVYYPCGDYDHNKPLHIRRIPIKQSL